MTQSLTILGPAPAVRRAARRQWVVRVVSGLVILAAVAYASLPVWLPKGWIAARLAEQLSLDLNRTVRIERARIGWTEGVIFENITVDDRLGAVSPLLARIGQIRCDFAPLTTLLDNRVGQIEIVDPEFWLVIDEAGRSNLDSLGEQRDGRLPSLHYAISNLICHVMTPGVSQAFRIDRLNLHLEPPSGRLELAAVTKVDRVEPDTGEPQIGRLSVDANLKVPRLKRSEALSGDIRIEWSDLALNDLPVPLISRVPVEQVDGTTTGGIHLTTHPDLKIDYELDIAFDGVQIMRPELQRPAQVPDAELRCGGHWDPTAEVVRLDHLRYTTPAVEVHGITAGQEPALRVEKNGEVPFELHLAGRIRDWQALRRELPEIDAYARAIGANLSGSAEFSAEVVQGASTDRFRLSLDGAATSGTIADGGQTYLAMSAGTPKHVRAELTHDRAGRRLLCPRLDLAMAGLAVEASGDIALPKPGKMDAGRVATILELMPGVQASLSAQCTDMASVRRGWPVLDGLLAGIRASGPAQIDAGLKPEADRTRLNLALALAVETELEAGDLFAKPAGHPCDVQIRAGLPFSLDGHLDDLQLEAKYRGGQLRIDADGAGLRYRCSFVEDVDVQPVLESFDASWEMPLSAEHIEDLATLFPRWQSRQAAGNVPELSGAARLDTRSSVSYRPDDWLIQNEFHVLADGLAVRWNDWLDKTENAPLDLTVSHRSQLAGGQAEHAFNLAFVQPTGEIVASAAVAGMGTEDLDDDFEQFSFSAEIHDVADWLRVSPLVSAAIKKLQATGAVSIQLDQLRLGRWQTGHLSIDATKAVLLAAESGGIDKRAGVVAGAKIRWEAQPGTDDPDTQVWDFSDGSIRLAGLNVESISGRVIAAAESGKSPAAIHAPGGLHALRRDIVESAEFQVRGGVALTSPLASLHPRLREWIEALDLSGDGLWEAQVRADGDSLAVDARLQADTVGFSLETGHPLVPTVHKRIGVPILASVTASVDHWLDPDGAHLDLHELALDVEDNHLSVAGSVDLRADESGNRRATGVQLRPRIDLQQPRQLLSLLPRSPLDMMEGSLTASLDIGGSPAIAVEGGEVRFSNFEIGEREHPLRLDGIATFNTERIDLEQVHWTWGQSAGVVSGLLEVDPTAPSGVIGLVFETLHAEDLVERATQLLARFTTTEAGPQSTPADTSAGAREIIEHLRQADLVVDAHAGTLHVTLPLSISAICDALSQRATLRNGEVELEFGTLIDGGRVEGRVESDLNVSDPTFHLTYTAERIQPGAVVDAYLRRTFPGMIATGPLTLIDETFQKILPAPGEANYEIGRGELIIESGTVSGRAAPLWMTRIFPGLNLATYEFTYMHSWFEKTASGRTHHQMIYQGAFYNIYMIGYSEPDGSFNYEVGLDFLARFDSEYWADVGQGRVPLFTKTGRVLPDGTLMNEVVTFVSIQRVLETLLVQNNPVITAYHVVRKRVLGKK